jgi:hypothetical protein
MNITRSLVPGLVALASSGCCGAPPPAPEPAPVAAAPAPAPAPTPTPAVAVGPARLAPAREQRIDIDVVDMDLADVCDRIGRQVGQNILVDPTVRERVTVCLRDISWREAVDVIARMSRCEVQEHRDGFLVQTP